MDENNANPKPCVGSPCWHFCPIAPGDVEQNVNDDEFFRDNTPLESVVREGIQNSLDARVSRNAPVRVRFYYSGAGAAMLPSNRYARYRAGAEDHLGNMGNGLHNRPRVDEPCPFLVLEDFNTTGLSGDVREKPAQDTVGQRPWNYYNYFFREGNAHEGDEGRRGSRGTGKSAFMGVSRLRTAFALSVRDGETPRRFLAARMRLHVHTDGEEKTWSPHAWFGCAIAPDPVNPRRNVNLPVEDAAFMDAFAQDFKLQRGDKPGTSIVIPYVNLLDPDGHPVFDREKFIRAAIRNFLPAILNGDLVVEIATGDGADSVTLDRNTVGRYPDALPAGPDDEHAVTRKHYEMIREASTPDFPAARVFQLNAAGSQPKLENLSFAGLDLKALKAVLKEGKTLLFKVEMPIYPDGRRLGVQRGSLRVLIAKADFPRSVRPVFYRLGLLIGSVGRTASDAGHAAVVLVDDGPVSQMLKSAEPPNHGDWNAERLSAHYRYANDHLKFVRRIATYILEQIENADNEADWDVLTDDFGVPDDEPETPPAPPSPPPTPGPGPGPGPRPPAPAPILYVEKIEGGGETGFVVSMEAGRLTDADCPLEASFRLSYPPMAWSRYDFDLADRASIKIVSTVGTDALEVRPKDNKLTLRVLKPVPFALRVTGFDPNCDLAHTPVKYVHPKGK